MKHFVQPINIGVIGAGMISETYLTTLSTSALVRIRAIADLIPDKAEQRAREFKIDKSSTVEEVLADRSIDLILNLTVPNVHAKVSLQAIGAGKHVYSEKPLSTNVEDGKRIIEEANSKGLKVGCAPDTFLGGGFQTARKLFDEGWIGKAIGAIAVRADHGPDEHPNAAFFYQKGGGPLFDMGPYYLTELINLFGPIENVSAMAKVSFSERKELSKPPWGRTVKVEVPTFVSGTLQFHSGVICSTINTFDVWAHNLPHIEIYGTNGTLQVPNPNRFGGNAKIKRMTQENWTEIPPLGGFMNDLTDYRGIGLLDMVLALTSGRKHRANVETAFHVVETMQGMHESSQSGKFVRLQSSCERPAPLPLDPTSGEISPLPD